MEVATPAGRPSPVVSPLVGLGLEVVAVGAELDQADHRERVDIIRSSEDDLAQQGKATIGGS